MRKRNKECISISYCLLSFIILLLYLSQKNSNVSQFLFISIPTYLSYLSLIVSSYPVNKLVSRCLSLVFTPLSLSLSLSVYIYIHTLLYIFSSFLPPIIPCPVGWGYRIHQLHLCRGVRPPRSECPVYDTQQFDG